MKLKTFYLIQSIFYGIVGILILLNIPGNVIGAAIGVREIKTSTEMLFGIFFLIGGIFLLILSKKN